MTLTVRMTIAMGQKQKTVVERCRIRISAGACLAHARTSFYCVRLQRDGGGGGGFDSTTPRAGTWGFFNFFEGFNSEPCN